MSPEQVFRRLVDGVSRLMDGDLSQIDGLVALYAEPTHVTHPMLPDLPLLTSRAELREHFAKQFERAQGLRFKAEGILVHQTTDPEVIVAEFTYRGPGKVAPLAAPCVFVMRIRDGLIVESRDYFERGAFRRALSTGRA
jgi:ketosteroid isomerase-like protein